MDRISVERVTGELLAARLDELARLRIEIFREWPYLYEGSIEYERNYLATYAKSGDSAIFAARDGEMIVGAATGLPAAQASENVRRAFSGHGVPLDPAFYFGESVLDPAYRGRGIGVRFFAEREAYALGLGYRTAYFCGVVRAERDPRRPPDWQPLDSFWRKRGYAPVPGMLARFSWMEVGAAQSTEKEMQFWSKDLGQ
jgi:GNAT superfamily N-acetyltransferase